MAVFGLYCYMQFRLKWWKLNWKHAKKQNKLLYKDNKVSLECHLNWNKLTVKYQVLPTVKTPEQNVSKEWLLRMCIQLDNIYYNWYSIKVRFDLVFMLYLADSKRMLHHKSNLILQTQSIWPVAVNSQHIVISNFIGKF